jgi:hypothetical protein
MCVLVAFWESLDSLNLVILVRAGLSTAQWLVVQRLQGVAKTLDPGFRRDDGLSRRSLAFEDTFQPRRDCMRLLTSPPRRRAPEEIRLRASAGNGVTLIA